jgi:hypothetical protein
MAVLRITNFGGVLPKVEPRALPDTAAQEAHNIDPGSTDFRPLGADSTVLANSGVNNPLTIYRLQLKADGNLNTDFTEASTWKVYAGDVSLVKGQINSDTTDRHYLTYNDGSAAPRAIDATGSDRQLGVPAPTTAPTVVVNEVDEFTTDERAAGLASVQQVAAAAIRANATASWVGADHPGTGTTGYGDVTPAFGFGITEESLQVRAYRLTGSGGTISNSYSTTAATEFSWVFDPLLGGTQGQAAATPAWAGGAGTWHWFLTYPAYGRGYTLNTAAIETALEAIAMPGTTDGTKLLTSAQVDEILAELDDYVDPTNDVVGPLVNALKQKVAQLKALLDGGPRASLAATRLAFYSKTDVAAAIAAAKTNFYNTVYNQADLVARSSTPADGVGTGGLDVGIGPN